MARTREFGKNWDVRIPRGQIKWLVDKMHVSLTNDQVREQMRERCKRDARFTPGLVRQCEEYAVICHERNYLLYRKVMTGNLK